MVLLVHKNAVGDTCTRTVQVVMKDSFQIIIGSAGVDFCCFYYPLSSNLVASIILSTLKTSVIFILCNLPPSQLDLKLSSDNQIFVQTILLLAC